MKAKQFTEWSFAAASAGTAVFLLWPVVKPLLIIVFSTYINLLVQLGG